MNIFVHYIGQLIITWIVFVIYSTTMYISIPFVTGAETYADLMSKGYETSNKAWSYVLKFFNTFRKIGRSVSDYIRDNFKRFDYLPSCDSRESTYDMMIAIESALLFIMCGLLHFVLSILESLFGTILGLDEFFQLKTLYTILVEFSEGNKLALFLLPVSFFIDIVFYAFIFGLTESRMYTVLKKDDTETSSNLVDVISDCTPYNIIETLFNIRSNVQTIRENAKTCVDSVIQIVSSTLYNEFCKLLWFPKALVHRVAACTIYFSVIMLLCIIPAIIHTALQTDYTSHGLITIFSGLIDSSFNSVVTLLISMLLSVLFKCKEPSDAMQSFVMDFQNDFDDDSNLDVYVKGYVYGTYDEFPISSSTSEVKSNNTATDQHANSAYDEESDLRAIARVNELKYEDLIRTHGSVHDALVWCNNEIHEGRLDPAVLEIRNYSI